MLFRLFIATFVLAASTFIAHADTFSYDFTYANVGDSFTYDSPILITTNTSITPTTCFSDTHPCSKVDFGISSGYFLLHRPDGGEELISNLPASFFTVGTHSDRGRVITITDNPDPTSPVPEPSSIALLGTGILGLAGVARRKLS